MKKIKVEFFKGKNRNWYWHTKSKNGKLICQCAEGDGFKTKAKVLKNFQRCKESFVSLDLIVVFLDK